MDNDKTNFNFTLISKVGGIAGRQLRPLLVSVTAGATNQRHVPIRSQIWRDLWLLPVHPLNGSPLLQLLRAG